MGFLRVEFSGIQQEREEKVSLELSEEILQSMEVGMAFKDYVSEPFHNNALFFLFFFRVNTRIDIRALF